MVTVLLESMCPAFVFNHIFNGAEDYMKKVDQVQIAVVSVGNAFEPELPHVSFVLRKKVRVTWLHEPCHPSRQDDENDIMVIASLRDRFVDMAFGGIQKEDDLVLYQFVANVNSEGVNENFQKIGVHPTGFLCLHINIPWAPRHDLIVLLNGQDVFVSNNELRQFLLNARVVANERSMRETCASFPAVGKLNWLAFALALLDDIAFDVTMKGGN